MIDFTVRRDISAFINSMANTFLIMHMLFSIITYTEFNELVRINTIHSVIINLNPIFLGTIHN